MTHDFDAQMREVNARTAVRMLRSALHWHRFFSDQTPGFSGEHAAMRADINARAVATYAAQAAMFARRTATTLEHWLADPQCSQAFAVDAIRDAFAKAWHDVSEEEAQP